jgi:[acyl-carrier-protein] S-malonyltransferase
VVTVSDTLDSTAFVFPGQGCQHPGMGRPFYDAWPEMRDRFDAVDAALDVDLHALCFDGPAERLQRPENTQPAMLALGASVAHAVFERFDVRPAYVAGHSLGHFTALTAADVADAPQLASVVRQRGEHMRRAEARDGPGKMVAVLLADPEEVAAVCDEHDGVGVALYNGPSQTVVSGRVDAVDAALDELADRARVRSRELDVGAAFHSPVMASAVDPVADLMTDVTFREATTPVVSDVSGRVYTDSAVATADLASQITSSVDWMSVAETLADRGVDRYVEFPPAGTLTSLVERIQPDATVVGLESPADAHEAFA